MTYEIIYDDIITLMINVLNLAGEVTSRVSCRDIFSN
jgi:hypothetical protein